jgi:hypothetical protein
MKNNQYAMTKKMKFIARMPHALKRVCGPRIDAVGRFWPNLFAALESGRLNAIVIGQKPSMKTQHLL